MSNRFERLSSLPSQLYTPATPIMITAGALLKDTQTGKVLAQLKIKNISPKIIKAVSISLVPFDTALQPMSEKETHQLLDLSAQRDSEFGQKTPLYFSNHATRAFQVIVENVVFADNTTWKSDGAPLLDLPSQKFAANDLADAELEKQYRLKYGESAAYVGDTCFDLWRCKCGAVNHDEEARCHSCNTSKDTALSFDLEQLKSGCQKRLEEERIASQQKLAQNRLRKKKTRNRAIIIIAVIILLSVGAAVSNSMLNRYFTTKYESALNGAVFIGQEKGRGVDSMWQVHSLYSFSELQCQVQSTIMESNKYGVSWDVTAKTDETIGYRVQ